VIRADLTLVPDPAADADDGVPAPLRRRGGASRTSAKAQETQAVPDPAPAVPSWARASGRAGQGDPLFAAGAGLALLDAFLRRAPPAAGALSLRLALTSAAASAKILRLNADTAALRDLRFAIGDDSGPAARLLRLWRTLASRPPGLDPGRIADAAARLDCAPPDSESLAAGLRDLVQGPHDPVSAAAKAAAFTVSVFPDAPAAEAEIFALWAFDLVIATRLRWPRPLPLIATKILDPSLSSDGGGRRPRPGEPAWQKHAAAAIALAAASALDLAGGLSRGADALRAVAPKLRAKPASIVVELLLAEDCVSPVEAARQAPMTDRAARRLFDRLVLLGAARELTGRPTFRLYGL
jgi:hypothetical protein